MNQNPSSTCPGTAIVKQWEQKVNQGNLEEITALYSLQASLLPTFSPDVKNHPTAIKEYFVNLTKKTHPGVTFETFTSQKTNSSTYIIYGLYTFFWEQDGQRQEFPSRYTFIVDTSQQAPIQHHHSSQLPSPA